MTTKQPPPPSARDALRAQAARDALDLLATVPVLARRDLDPADSPFLALDLRDACRSHGLDPDPESLLRAVRDLAASSERIGR